MKKPTKKPTKMPMKMPMMKPMLKPAQNIRGKMLDLARIENMQRKFSKARQWDQFHTPKNLAIALSVEASELLELVQWKNDAEVCELLKRTEDRVRFQDELADVLYYLVRLADVAQVDLEESFWIKMKKNARKYPVALARGNAKKYTEFSKKGILP